MRRFLSAFYGATMPDKYLSSPEFVSRADIDVIKTLTRSYKGHQLRLPLHAAVMLSPLYLLAPLQLYSVKWERQAMFRVRASFSLMLVPLSDDC